MNIANVLGTQQTSTADGPSRWKSQMNLAMDAVAKKLGMSDSDLQSALQSGKSLTDIAKSKGVSSDDLLSTVKDALKSANPNMSDTQLSNIANRIVNHKGGHHHHHTEGAASVAPPASTSSDSTSSSSSSTTGSILSILM